MSFCYNHCKCISLYLLLFSVFFFSRKLLLFLFSNRTQACHLNEMHSCMTHTCGQLISFNKRFSSLNSTIICKCFAFCVTHFNFSYIDYVFNLLIKQQINNILENEQTKFGIVTFVWVSSFVCIHWNQQYMLKPWNIECIEVQSKLSLITYSAWTYRVRLKWKLYIYA